MIQAECFNLNIRPECKNKYHLITRTINAALGQPNECRLVENLRKNKKFIPQLSLISQMNDEIVAHILFFPIKIMDGKLEYDSIALAPVSVHPDYQKKD
jgi:putative acetyltransferase